MGFGFWREPFGLQIAAFSLCPYMAGWQEGKVERKQALRYLLLGEYNSYQPILIASFLSLLTYWRPFSKHSHIEG